jgi:MoxR-like ATPase
MPMEEIKDITNPAESIRILNEEIQVEIIGINRIREEVSRVIIGQKVMIDRLLIGLLAEGHILLEGLPGLAKTLAVKTLSDSLDLTFSRVQFTPDLLPADVTSC